LPSRVVRAEINSSASLSRVSMQADLTFRALIVAVDDYGRMDARPEMLKAELFPTRSEATPAKIAQWLVELAEDGCVLLYEVDGRRYLELTGWEKHRSNSKRAAKSRFPSPHTSPDPREIHGSPENPPVLRLTSDEYRVTSDESARETPGRKPARTSAPDDLTPEQWERLEAWTAIKEPWATQSLGDLVSNCLGHFRASGKPMCDWYETCRNWIRRQRTDFGGVSNGRGKKAHNGLADATRNILAEIDERERRAAREGAHVLEAVRLIPGPSRRDF
jgi:hypothetical protein